MASTDLRARVKVRGVERYLGKFLTTQEAREAERLWRITHNIQPFDRSEAARKAALTKRMRSG